MEPTEYFGTLNGHAFGASGRAVVFYPGSGEDDGPVDFFLNSTDEGVDLFYVDYINQNINLDRAISKIKKAGPRAFNIEVELTPRDFGVKCIRDFYPLRSACTEEEWDRLVYEVPWLQDDSPVTQERLGFRISNGRDSITFLVAEAIQCYKILQKNGIFPNVVVLEDPCFGGEWTCFGGDSKLFRAAKIQPRYLYVAEGTDPWPNYVQVTNHRIDENSAHRRSRSIYSNRWFG
jgi:hypothetical protein